MPTNHPALHSISESEAGLVQGITNAMKSTTENTQAPYGDSLLKKPQVAKELSVCNRSVDNLIRARALAFVRIGRSVRFERSAVEAFKASRRVNAAA